MPPKHTPVQVSRDSTGFKFVYRKESRWGSIWKLGLIPAIILSIYLAYNEAQSLADKGLLFGFGAQFSAFIAYVVPLLILIVVIIIVGSFLFGSGKGSFWLTDAGVRWGNNLIPWDQVRSMYIKSSVAGSNDNKHGVIFRKENGDVYIENFSEQSAYFVANTYNYAGAYQGNYGKRNRLSLITNNAELTLASAISVACATALLNQLVNTGSSGIKASLQGKGRQSVFAVPNA